MRRMMMAVGIVAFFALGCGPPTTMLAGGKPVGHWLKALQDPNPAVRKSAVNKLGNVGAADPAVLPALMGALKDPDAAVRCQAILALLRSDSAAAGIIPALTQLQQNDPNSQVRSYAAQALQTLQGAK